MTSISDPADNFDRGFERIETRTEHGTVHIHYRMTDTGRGKLCASGSMAALITNPPYGGENPVALDLPVLLDVLGYTDGEFVSIGHDSGGRFSTAIITVADAGVFVAGLPDSANVYFGVNPIAGYVTERGTWHPSRCDPVGRVVVRPRREARCLQGH